MNEQFWSGVIAAVCYYQGMQGFMGKEKYLQAVDVLWMNESPWIWVVVGTLAIWSAVAGNRKLKKRLE